MRELTDDVRRKQNCQDDHGWQGKSLPAVTGQASFRMLALGGKAVSLRQSYRTGGGLCNWRKRKQVSKGEPDFCAFEVGSAQAWKTGQPLRHLVVR